MKSKYIMALALALVSASAASAQELWTSANAEFSLTKKLKAGIELQCRTTDKVDDVGRWSVGADLSYRFCKYLKADAAYTFIYQRNGDEYDDEDTYIPSYWQPRQRVQLSLTGSYKIGRLAVSLREGYQYTYHRERSTVPTYDIVNDSWLLNKVTATKHKAYLRSRLELEYNIRKSRFTPFASCELYNDISGFDIKKVRYTVGTEYKINRHNGVQLFYRYIDSRKSDNSNVIGVGYTYKFN
jgi:hypothetical protein